MKWHVRRPSYYPETEEKLNVMSHGLGFILSVVGFGFLLHKCFLYQDIWVWISFVIYGLSMMLLYAASTLYHSAKNKKLRYRLGVFDHTAIFVLIAGSYTPFTLVTLRDTTGLWLFGIVWTIAVIGIAVEILYTSKFSKLSTALYLTMGWLIVFSFKSLYHSLDFNGILLLFGGGLAYSIGALFFVWEKLKYNHAIFHFFVKFIAFLGYL